MGKSGVKIVESKSLFIKLIESNYRVEFLLALKEIICDIKLLGGEVDKFLGNLNDNQFKSMLKKSEQRVELLKVLRSAIEDYKKNKLKGKIKGFLEISTQMSFEETLVMSDQQKEFLQILEEIIGRKAYVKETAENLEKNERALAIQEKHYGPDHFQVAITLVNLGICLWGFR